MTRLGSPSSRSGGGSASKREAQRELEGLIRWVNTMPGRRCMTCADPRALDDGEVLRELERLALDGLSIVAEREDGSGSVVSALRRLRRGGVRLDATDDVFLARGFCSGDPEAQAHVLREIKEALETRVASADPTLVAPAAARAESQRRAADAEARAAAASARAAAIVAESGRRPVSALERLSGDPGLDARVSKSPREPTFDGLSTLRRLAGEPSDDEDVEDDVDVNDSSRDAPPVHEDASRFDADPGSETGSLRDWGRDPRDPMSRDDAKTKTKTNRLSGVSSASAYAAAADAAEAAARAYASRAEEARRARSAFLDDEAAARRAASSESPASRERLATSPDANDARRGFRGGTPPPADAAFLPTPRDSAQAWSRGGLSRVARLTPEQQDAVVWILGLGVEVAGASVAGDVVVGLPRATGIQAEMAKGALLCRLAETLEGTHLGETHRRPKVKAEATHNINKALAVFRRAGRVAPRYLWSAAELAEGDAKSAWGVLFDIRAAYDAAFEKSVSKKNSPNMPGGRVRGRRLRVTPRVDARGGAYGDPGDVAAAEAGEGRLPRTPPRAGSGAPFRERNADVSASRGSSATFKSPKAGASSGVASWRRAAPGVPLTARGLPSPLARAAAKVAAARAKRVARLMGDADRAEKTAKIRRAVAADAAATATRAAFEAAAAEAELEAAEEEEALLALEAAARADAAERAERGKMRDGAAGARFSRGGAVKGALSRDAKARAASARAARPDFVPSGYVSPNENARRRSRSLTRDRDSATRARTRTTSPSPRDAAASENGTARRGLTFSSAAPKAECADSLDVEPRAKQPKAKETEHSRVASLARRAAETAALAGAVPVVFEYREGPLPAPPPPAERDEEVRAWLASLRLSVLPREEEADLLSNPLRNGTLLRDVMTVLVGAPPLTRRERAPRTLDAARLNVEKALAPLRAVPGAVPPGLTWSTEGVLKGIREHTFGLLWYVKRAALGRVAGSEARRRESLASSAGIFQNAREGPPAAGALGGGLARASTPARSRRLFDDGDENGHSSSSSSPPHYAGVPTAEGGARARTSSSKRRVFRDADAENGGANTTVGASASESVSPSDSSPREYLESERTNVLVPAPSLGYEALPRYSPDAVRRLEASTVAWLARTGLLGDEATVAKKSFVALCPALATGVALCDLVTAIEGVPVVGVFRNPKSVATAEANARRACERLARHKNMSRRFLFRADDIAAGVVGVLLGLLEDVRVFHDGLPPRVDGSKKWDPCEPYCPETTSFGDDVSKNVATANLANAFSLTNKTKTVGVNGVKTPETLFSRFASPARTLRSLGKNVTAPVAGYSASTADADEPDADSDRKSRASNAPSPSAGLSAEPSPVAGGPTRVVASVAGVAGVDGDASPSEKKPNTTTAAPRSPRLADAPEAAARAAAAALAGWHDGVAKDLVADDVSFSGFRPTISSDSVTSVGREHTWEPGSFPRTRATPAEAALREERRSAARAARAVADAYLTRDADARSKPKPTGAGGRSRELSTAARARAAERARKEAAAAHAAAEKKTQTVANARSGTQGSLSRTRPSNGLVGSSASKADPETVSKPPRRPPRPPGTQKSFAKAEADAPPAPSPPRSPRPRSRTFDSSPNRRRPVRFVPPPSPEEEKREAREREALRAARWIHSLGVSLRRAGASIGAGWSSDDARVSSRDPFAEATRSPAAELAAVCADGTLLCELVRVLEKKELVGVTWRPCSNASRLHNVGKALAAMRRQPAMSPMHLWCEKDVVAADEETVVGLLGDMRACAAYKRAGRRG